LKNIIKLNIFKENPYLNSIGHKTNKGGGSTWNTNKGKFLREDVEER
jgi:hypothetical protein